MTFKNYSHSHTLIDLHFRGYKSVDEFFKINEKLRRGDIVGCVGHPGKKYVKHCFVPKTSYLIIRDIGLSRHAIENEIDNFENTDCLLYTSPSPRD